MTDVCCRVILIGHFVLAVHGLATGERTRILFCELTRSVQRVEGRAAITFLRVLIKDRNGLLHKPNYQPVNKM